MEKKRIFLSPPSTNGQELQAVVNAISSNWIAPSGPYIDKFESKVCSLVGAKHAVAVSSGTAAIHLALIALGVTQGDTVFCSDLTFAGSCFPILYQKASPVFIDCKTDGWGMSEIALQKAFHAAKLAGKMPKAVIIVDLYGQSADYDKLLPICDYYGVPVIEDAAEAVGSRYHGKSCGTFGKLSVFSFNGNKIITASSGGMLVSDNAKLIEKVKFWSTQSREPEIYYQHKEIGYNYRMSNICAAIGYGQLDNLEERIRNRKNIYYGYHEAFQRLPVEMMTKLENSDPNYWLSVLTINENSVLSPIDIINELQKIGIESRHAWKPMHLQPVFSKCKFFTAGEAGSFEKSAGERIFNRGICLPSGTDLSILEQQEVIQLVVRMFAMRNEKAADEMQVGA